jgi:hypothetical protein
VEQKGGSIAEKHWPFQSELIRVNTDCRSPMAKDKCQVAMNNLPATAAHHRHAGETQR